MAESFDIEQAFAALNDKIDKLTPAQQEEISGEAADVEADVESAADDGTAQDEFDARTAIAELSAKIDALLAKPRTKTVRTVSKNVPAAPARRPAKPQPAATTDPGTRRRGWFPP